MGAHPPGPDFHLHQDDETLHVGEIQAQGSQLLRQLLCKAQLAFYSVEDQHLWPRLSCLVQPVGKNEKTGKGGIKS